MASIVQTTNLLSDQQEREELRKLLAAILADLTALRTTLGLVQADVVILDTGLDTLVAKLNLDAGVTDANYAGAAALTSAAPSALTVTA
jgi:hypothetical protein